jgi:hypothetical protein
MTLSGVAGLKKPPTRSVVVYLRNSNCISEIQFIGQIYCAQTVVDVFSLICLKRDKENIKSCKNLLILSNI